MTERIGFIGLGIMGRPMAQNLLRAGYGLTVYNRSRGPVAPLVAAGASAAESPQDVAYPSPSLGWSTACFKRSGRKGGASRPTRRS